jgi:hypothetical protein
MIRRVLLAGTLTFTVLTLWIFLVNVLPGFTVHVAMNRAAGERAVYRVLKENITAPAATCG